MWATVQNEIDPDAILEPLTVRCADTANAMQIRQRPSTENKMSAAHGHARANFNHAFAIRISLNLAFVAIEAFYGWKVNSLALLADAATTSAM